MWHGCHFPSQHRLRNILAFIFVMELWRIVLYSVETGRPLQDAIFQIGRHNPTELAKRNGDDPSLFPIIPLQLWEVVSAAERICAPPAGIPSYCCLGSSSSGHEINFHPEKCLNNLDNMLLPYEKLQNLSLQWLQDHPLPFPGERTCDLCQILEVLFQHNLTLAFLGDSMTRQVTVGLDCDLRRQGYNVTSWIDKLTNDTSFQPYRWDSTQHVHVTSNDGQQSTTIRFFNMFRPDAAAREAIFRMYPGIDILVFDHGVHYQVYKQLHEFMRDSTAELDWLRKRVPLILWRESSSQHFDTPGGHFRFEVLRNRDSCIPMKEADYYNTSFTTNSMRDLLHAMNLTLVDASAPNFTALPETLHELVMLPFRQFTKTLWELHPGFPDCTHFCTTPYVWLPIWRSLRVAIERSVRYGRFEK
ncbi:hypothetical protein MPSEU_000918700 [Mayamaea pseudoterrestris]|nr:hypothetical protein MPSEU_000918700 [Mayamaea pseudoterrestris]